MTRIYKLKGFARFQRKEQIEESALCEAVRRVDLGLIDANLGAGLVKQRLARPGRGRSGGFRTVIAIKHGDLAVFLYGFAKNERSNIGADELAEFRRLAQGFLGLTEKQINELAAGGELLEVRDDEAR